MNQETEPSPEGAELYDGEPVEAELVEAELVEVELVAGLPAAVDQHDLAPSRWSEHPTVQAAAAAATGFVAGAATLALMRRYGLRRVARQVQDVRDVLDADGNRWRGPVPSGPGQTYLVHVRVVTPPPPE